MMKIEELRLISPPDLTIQKYQIQALQTAVYPKDMRIVYPALGLAGEAGEVANKVKKLYRDGGLDDKEKRGEVAKEIADCLWYCAALAHDLGVSLGFIAKQNLLELASRAERGTLHGSGDNR
jgi:NTP pyrophosphatase (non-canonical NTP hydrolase)